MVLSRNMVDVMEFAAIFSLGQSWAYMWAIARQLELGILAGLAYISWADTRAYISALELDKQMFNILRMLYLIGVISFST